MSTTVNLGITLLEAGLRQPEVRVNDAFTTLDDQFILPTSWTPTWTNLSVGNGTVVAKYVRVGKWIICRLSLVFGSTTSISGDVEFTLPVTRAAIAGTPSVTFLGSGGLYDSSASALWAGAVAAVSNTGRANIRPHDSSGTHLKIALLSSTIPFTWAVGDEIAIQFLYEAA